MIERDEWLYVQTTTADRAREFFGLPADTVVEQYCHRPGDELPCWAVKAPNELVSAAVAYLRILGKSPGTPETDHSAPVPDPTPQPAPARKVLSPPALASIARQLLLDTRGFTLDEYGQQPEGELWAVSVEGKEKRFECLPAQWMIVEYIKSNSFGAAHFSGWADDDGTYYLDHTLLYACKHTAIQEAIRNNQKAIFNLGTREIVKIEGD